MRNYFLVLCYTIMFFMACATSNNNYIPAVATPTITTPAVTTIEGLLSWTDAKNILLTEIELKIPRGAEIIVSKITAPRIEIGNFFANEISTLINQNGNFLLLAREDTLSLVIAELEFQMSGFVSDASALSIGNFLGAKVIVTGSFEHYANFSQLLLRIVDVESSVLLSTLILRLRNDDQVLSNILMPLQNAGGVNINEQTLAHMNRGKELFAEEMFDGAIGEFERAIALNRNLAEAFYYRAYAMMILGLEADQAMSDLNQAITLDPNLAGAFMLRSYIHNSNMNTRNAIVDITQAIRLDPHNPEFYIRRGDMYINSNDYERALADFTLAIRLAPENPFAHWWRASRIIDNWEELIYFFDSNQTTMATVSLTFLSTNNLRRMDIDGAISELNLAIDDLTNVIKLDPNHFMSYLNRGYLHYNVNNDFNNAIADYTYIINLFPNYAPSFFMRGNIYLSIGNFDQAIADFEMAIQLDPDYRSDSNFMERLEQARRR